MSVVFSANRQYNSAAIRLTFAGELRTIAPPERLCRNSSFAILVGAPVRLVMRKILRIGTISLILLVAVAGVGLLVAWWGASHVPEFYERALTAEPEQLAQAGDKLEENILELRNNSLADGQWRATFTDEQINGWLAVDLPEKFPRTLPPQVKDPRVAIEPDLAQVAARLETPRLTTVISLAVDVRLTDEPNELAIRIHQARAGMLPVPLSEWLDRVTEAAEEGGIPLRWAEEQGDPVAIVTVPLEDKNNREHVLRLTNIELHDGELVVAGVTQPAASEGSSEGSHGELRYSRSNQTTHR
jgi:hypothetical protein